MPLPAPAWRGQGQVSPLRCLAESVPESPSWQGNGVLRLSPYLLQHLACQEHFDGAEGTESAGHANIPRQTQQTIRRIGLHASFLHQKIDHVLHRLPHRLTHVLPGGEHGKMLSVKARGPGRCRSCSTVMRSVTSAEHSAPVPPTAPSPTTA